MDGGRMESITGRGITLLKRGQTLMDFVKEFLHSRNITSYSIHERGDGWWATAPMMFLNQEPKRVLTFHFLQFDFDSIGFHAKDLSAKELERDLKPLQKLIYKN